MRSSMRRGMRRWFGGGTCAWMLCMFLALLLSFSMKTAVFATDAAAVEQTEAVLNGWVTNANGKTFYYIDGVKATGLQTIDSKTYYFKTSNGVMVTEKWVTFKKGKSWFNKKGERVTGLQKIKKKYYYFNKNGILKTGTKKDGKNTYYADSKGVLYAWKIGSKYYKSNGKRMDSVDKKEFKTYLRAKSIVEDITTSKMSKSQKLKVCFDWVMSKHYAFMTTGLNYPGWTADYANDHFLYGKGTCHADACALAYLAKAIGYDEVYACTDSATHGHGWCEINGLVYDPLFAQAKSYSKYYAASYSTYYTQHPVLHEKILSWI